MCEGKSKDSSLSDHVFESEPSELEGMRGLGLVVDGVHWIWLLAIGGEGPDLSVADVHGDFAEGLLAAVGCAEEIDARLEIDCVRAGGLRLNGLGRTEGADRYNEEKERDDGQQDVGSSD
jgi:hypothetical protein